MISDYMRSGWKLAGAARLLLAVSVVSVVAVISMVAQTSGRANRIVPQTGAQATVTMAGSVHPLTRRATDLGAVNPALRMESLTLNTSVGAAEQAELDALLAAQQDAGSGEYHRWLTQEEYGARFGLTEADLGEVTGWLAAEGLTVKGVSRSRNAIYFSGRAAQVELAFGTELHRYQLRGETHFANATQLRVPAAMAGVMLQVGGLNDFRLKPRNHRRHVAEYTAGTSQGIMNFLTPGDWATIYDVTPIYGAGYTGTGAYVGVVGQTYAPESDISNFRSAAGLGPAKLIYACIDPVAAHCTGTAAISTVGDLNEADLDIEWAGGIAYDATVEYVYAPYSDVTGSAIDPVTEQYYGVFDALQRAVEDITVAATGRVLPVLSMSYSDCEESFGGYPAYVQWVTSVGEQANAQGQTIVVASGDTGPAGCDWQDDYPANMGVSVGVPVDSPNYTGVGGTTLSGDENNPAAYWVQTLGTVNSALAYIPETAWNDTASDEAEGYPRLSATGGGVSLYYAQPTWQTAPANYSGTAGRFVPDVSFAASPNHDGYMTCSSANDSSMTGNDCANGFLSSRSYWDVIGGTSAGTPSFAGMLTLLVEKYGSFGNINPTLYRLASSDAAYARVFHDITEGNSVVPCTTPTKDVPDPGCVDNSMGWYAAAGYDATTGLGSVDGYALYEALMASTATTVEAVPSSVGLGGTTTLTATVTSNTAGAITGQVTFAVGATTLGTAALAGGVATLANVAVTLANGFADGADTVTASYGGDQNNAASSGTAGLTVGASLTTTTVGVSPASIALGSGAATASLTATVAGGGATPAGTVTFQVGGVTLASAVTLTDGRATLGGIAPTAANGFTVGNLTVTARYTPANGLVDEASDGSTGLTVTAPAYTMTPPATAVALSPGESEPVTVSLASAGFADTVSWTATSDSAAITVSPASGSAKLAAKGSGEVKLTITASGTAAGSTPRLPWSLGAMALGTVLAGIPLGGRRRVAAGLLLSLAVAALAGSLGCGGSGGAGSSTPEARSYTVTVSGSGGVKAKIAVSVR
jgi:hypothetical protein